MKRFNYFLLGAAGLILASCSNEDLTAPGAGSGEANVSVNLSLPEIQTRAYSDGTKATLLQYAVYDVTETRKLIDHYNITEDKEVVKLDNKKKTVTFKLISGHTYDFVFWASTPQEGDPAEATNPYTVAFQETGATVTVDYTGVLANDENLDAFYVYLESVKVDGPKQIDAKLQRPFAQINLLTNDYAAAKDVGYEPNKSKVKISKVYKSLDLKTGEASDEAEVTFGYNNISRLGEGLITETSPTYEYLNMVYVLANADKSTVNVEYSWKQVDGVESTLPVSSVPVQRNHRTNIYGSILTNPVDINVEILPDFVQDGDHNYAIWDGVSSTKPEIVEGTAMIYTPAEWVYITGQAATKAASEFTNIVLGANLDFAGYHTKSFYFGGELDGKGHTMSNMVLTPKSDYATGLFQGDVSGGGDITVKDIIFDNIKAENYATNNGWAAVVIGDLQTCDITLENVTVRNADICGNKCIAGLVGFVASGRKATIKDCVVEDSYFHNVPVKGESGYVAGLVGRPVGTVEVSGSVVRNTKIHGYYASDKPENSINEAVGTKDNVDGVTIENVTVTRNSVIDDPVWAENLEDIASALSSGSDIFLPSDISAQGEKTYGYGGTNLGGATLKSGVFDGNNHTFDITTDGTYWTSNIYVNSGTVKNINLAGNSYNGLIIWNVTGDVYLDNVSVLSNSGITQTIMADGGNNHNIIATNCEFDGYVTYGTSFSNVTFKNCKFGTSDAISPSAWYWGGNKPKSNSLYENCEFDSNYYFDLSTLGTATIEFKNCTVNGELLTEENHADLMIGWKRGGLSYQDWDGYLDKKTQVKFTE